MKQLKGSIALVSGGAGALGSSIAGRFVREGASVVAVVTHSPVDPIPGVDYIACDMSDGDAVERLFHKVIATHGAVDHVVHTVGGFVPGGPIAETSVADWDRMMQLNLRTAFLCTRAALRAMTPNRSGHIVLISALSGLEFHPGRGAYSISKAGVNYLTEFAARESADAGITVNAIAPEILDTPANRREMPDSDPTAWVSTDAVAAQVIILCSGGEPATTGRIIRMEARH